MELSGNLDDIACICPFYSDLICARLECVRWKREGLDKGEVKYNNRGIAMDTHLGEKAMNQQRKFFSNPVETIGKV